MAKKAARTKGIPQATQEMYLAFIKAWNGSESKQQVADELEISLAKVNAWASKLRTKMDVPLKKFDRASRYDIAALVEAGKKTLKK